MSKQILILNQNSYCFTNSDNQKIEGHKLTYVNRFSLDLDNLTGYCPVVYNSKTQISKELIPGIFECEVISVPNSKGQSVEQIVSLKPIKKVDFSILFK